MIKRSAVDQFISQVLVNGAAMIGSQAVSGSTHTSSKHPTSTMSNQSLHNKALSVVTFAALTLSASAILATLVMFGLAQLEVSRVEASVKAKISKCMSSTHDIREHLHMTPLILLTTKHVNRTATVLKVNSTLHDRLPRQADSECGSCCLPGPPGAMGVPGLPGKDGIPGVQGFSGYPGRPPPTCEEFVEPPCSECPRGAPGKAGDQGEPGLPGIPGNPGRDGSDGRPAIPGPPGPPGDPGLPGLDSNISGDPGIPAINIPALPGDPGIAGNPGPPGGPGAPGLPGRAGVPGLPGPPGPSGLPGRHGIPGTPGPKGPLGLPGRQGSPGICCEEPIDEKPSPCDPEVPTQFRSSRIVPDAIPEPPKCLTQVEHRELQQKEVYLGSTVDLTYVDQAPTLRWSSRADQLWTVLCINLDYPNQASPSGRSYLLWLVVNCKGSDTASGDTLVQYQSPGSVELSGTHRIVFLIYPQNTRLSTSVYQNIYENSNAGRSGFSCPNFASSNDLVQPPHSGNFYRIIASETGSGSSLSCEASRVNTQFVSSEIVGDIVRLPPNCLCKVSYGAALSVDLGGYISPLQCRSQPSVSLISWPGDAVKQYTLLFVDMDIPGRDFHQGRCFLLWLVTNIPGSDLAQGNVQADYIGPLPQINTGVHRAAYLVYEQTRPIPDLFNEPRISSDFFGPRFYFYVEEFVKLHDLVPTAFAGNYFTCQHEAGVPEITMFSTNIQNNHINAFQSSSIVPQALAAAPTYECVVAFGDTTLEDAFTNGRMLQQSEVSFQPRDIAFPYKLGSSYAIMLIGLDEPSVQNPSDRLRLFWLKVNIPERDFSSGREIVPYSAPVPAVGSGQHRYVFLIYEQSSALNIDSTRILTSRFDLNSFVSTEQLTLFAGKYFKLIA